MHLKKQLKKINIKPIIKRITKFLNHQESFENDISFDDVIKLFAISIPVFSLLYLTFFYGAFTVNYFIYFNPIDLVQTYYQQNFTALLTLVLFGLFILFIKVNYKKNSNKAPINFWVFMLIMIEVFIVYKLRRDPSLTNTENLIIYTIASLLIIKILAYWSKFSLSIIIYCFLILQSLTAVYLGRYKAKSITENKINFDVILNDETYLMKEDKNDSCKYFIGSTSNYFFIYDGFTEKIRVKPMSEIKEISFSPKH